MRCREAGGGVDLDVGIAVGEQDLPSGQQQHPSDVGRAAGVRRVGNFVERGSVELEELRWAGVGAALAGGPGCTEDVAAGQQHRRGVFGDIKLPLESSGKFGPVLQLPS